jgi:lysine-N-methylase
MAGLKTLKYLEDFHCIGPDCPDSCCVGWQVFVDRANYSALRKASKKKGQAEVERFKRGVKRYRADATDRKFASMQLQDGGRCSFLRPDGLCHVHGEYGEALLSETCSMFPRSFSVAEQELTMGASLSCPEAARLCLLDAGATETVVVDDSIAPRPPSFGKNYDKAGATPWKGYVGVITSIMGQFMDLGDFPFASRLFFVCRLAELLNAAQPGSDSNDNLADALEAMADPQQLMALHEEVSALQPDPRVAMDMVQAFLLMRIRDGAGGRLKALLEQIIARYLNQTPGALDAADDEDQGKKFLESTTALYVDHRDFWTSRYPAQVDRHAVNFCKNYIVTDQFPNYSSPMMFAVNLAVTLLLFRFLTFSHPRLMDARSAGMVESDPDAAGRLLDEVAVDAVQRLYREFQHHPASAEMIKTELEQRGLVTLPFAAYLVSV